jgi:hypothetical protein
LSDLQTGPPSEPSNATSTLSLIAEESGKQTARGKGEQSKEDEESIDELIGASFEHTAPLQPECQHDWNLHLMSMDRHGEAVDNLGHGDCLFFAVADGLRDLRVEGEWTSFALRTLVCDVMNDGSRTGVWKDEWNGHNGDWERLIEMASPSGRAFMWMPHIRAMAVALKRCIVRIPMRQGKSKERQEIIRVFHHDPDHRSKQRGVVRPLGYLECCDYYSWHFFLEYWRELAPNERDDTLVILYNGSDHYLGTKLRRDEPIQARTTPPSPLHGA